MALPIIKRPLIHTFTLRCMNPQKLKPIRMPWGTVAKRVRRHRVSGVPTLRGWPRSRRYQNEDGVQHIPLKVGERVFVRRDPAAQFEALDTVRVC